MKWLIWKEYRLNRLILIVAATLLFLPHAVALILAWRGVGPPVAEKLSNLSANLLVSAFYSLILSQLTLALLGGNLIACERVDRSAEFLAYLPLSRRRILAGKITLALLTAALIWGLNLLILLLVVVQMPELLTASGSQEFLSLLANVALTGLVFFSVGWLLSSTFESPTFAICGGLITPFLIIMGIVAIAWLLEYPEGETMRSWYLWTCLTLASASFVAGTWYYLRRVEP